MWRIVSFCMLRFCRRPCKCFIFRKSKMESETIVIPGGDVKQGAGEKFNFRNSCRGRLSWHAQKCLSMKSRGSCKSAIQTFRHNSKPWISSQLFRSLNFRWRRRQLSVLYFFLILISFQSSNEVQGFVNSIRDGGKFFSLQFIWVFFLFLSPRGRGQDKRVCSLVRAGKS